MRGSCVSRPERRTCAECVAPRFGINGSGCIYLKLQHALAAASTGDTIQIREGAYAVLAAAGSDGVNIDKSVTLEGADAACDGNVGGAVVYHASTTRVFTIDNSASVTLRNFDIDGGAASTGGLVRVTPGASLYLEGMSLSNGVATARGGCVDVDGGRLEVSEGTEFNDCTSAGDGGAIYVHEPSGAIVVEDSSINTSLADVHGGGIAFYGPGVLEVDASFDGNRAGAQGGAVSVWSATDATISGTYLNNRAEADGGAIFVTNTPVVTSVVELTGNEALSRGGGMAAFYVDVLTLDPNNYEPDTAISGNTAFLRGGGLYLQSVESASLVGGTIGAGNHAIAGGGIAAASSSLYMSGIAVSGNTGTDGAGMWLDDSTLYADKASGNGVSIFTNNAAGLGGGILLRDSTATFEGVVLGSNSARDGGNFALTGSSAASLVKRTEIRDGIAEERGGNVFSNSSGVLTLDGLLGFEEFPTQAAGGAAAEGGNVYLDGSALVAINDAHLYDGTATVRGGSICAVNGASVELSGSAMFFDNDVPGNGPLFRSYGTQMRGTAPEGGAVYLDDSSLVANNLVIYSSTAAVAVHDSDFTASNTWILGGTGDAVTVTGLGAGFSVSADFNTCAVLGSASGERDQNMNEHCSGIVAVADGSALRVQAGTSVDLANALVRGNRGVAGRAIVDVETGASFSCSDCLFFENHFLVPGPADRLGLVATGASAVLDHTTLADEFLPFEFGSGSTGLLAAVVSWPASGTAGGYPILLETTLTASCLFGRISGSGTLVPGPYPNLFGVDPEYANPTPPGAASPNFRLNPLISPAIDLCDSPAGFDLDGLDRTVGAASDVGAFEVQ